MIADEMVPQLSALGFRIDGGYIFSGRYRHGRVGTDALYPEGESNGIPLKDIDHPEALDEGMFGLRLHIVLKDGMRLAMRREELPPSYSGLRAEADGGYAMPCSIADLMDAWGLVFPDFRSKCWLEITTNYIMVDTSLIGEEGIRSLDDSMLVRITGFVQNRLKQLGCRGKQPGKDVVGDVFISQANLNRSAPTMQDIVNQSIQDYFVSAYERYCSQSSQSDFLRKAMEEMLPERTRFG